VPSMACGSLLTMLVEGKTTEEARQLRREDLVQAIGGLPEASAHASVLAIDALAAALKQCHPNNSTSPVSSSVVDLGTH
jgi:nitrogen fixation NifU-like protein